MKKKVVSTKRGMVAAVLAAGVASVTTGLLVKKNYVAVLDGYKEDLYNQEEAYEKLRTMHNMTAKELKEVQNKIEEFIDQLGKEQKRALNLTGKNIDLSRKIEELTEQVNKEHERGYKEGQDKGYQLGIEQGKVEAIKAMEKEAKKAEKEAKKVESPKKTTAKKVKSDKTEE